MNSGVVEQRACAGHSRPHFTRSATKAPSVSTKERCNDCRMHQLCYACTTQTPLPLLTDATARRYPHLYLCAPVSQRTISCCPCSCCSFPSRVTTVVVDGDRPVAANSCAPPHHSCFPEPRRFDCAFQSRPRTRVLTLCCPMSLRHCVTRARA